MTTQADWKPLIEFVNKHQCDWSMQPDPSGAQWGIHLADDPPHNQLLGPVFERGPANGLIRQGGETICAWGDTHRADMTFSVTKTYLALVAGVAFDRGILPNLDQPIAQRLSGFGFDDEHNRQITWRQMLQFSSEWQGECFGVPEQIDRYRHIALQGGESHGRKGDARKLQTPGTHWEYNDVRINQFSKALMHLFEQPLPDILKETVAQPLGLSDNWHWHGYENSWCEINGKNLQSVPGGGHWGGGMVMSAEDQASIAQMMLNNGQAPANDSTQQLISREWLELMRTPCSIAPFYGFFTWLNTDHCISEHAPSRCFFAMGIGGQLLMHDPDNNLLAVFRWLDSQYTQQAIQLVYECLEA